MYSGGNKEWRACALEFTVDKKKYRIKTIKTILPEKNYEGRGQGNYELEDNGDYILTYGMIPEHDSSTFRNFMQFGKEDSIYARYQLYPYVYCFKAHKLNYDWRPQRPKIVQEGATLKAAGDMQNWIWYKLEGPDKTRVTKVGEGAIFKPSEFGDYCVEGKYGVGYSVSRSYSYKPTAPPDKPTAPSENALLT